MAGILASSADVTMVTSTPDNSNSGYVAGVQIALSTTPAGSSHLWSLAMPTGATAARVVLSDTMSATPTFTPQSGVNGVYTLICNVDGTEYVLRISVTAQTPINVTGAMRLLPVTGTSVPTPDTGATIYFDSATSKMRVKLDDGSSEDLH